MLLSPREFAVVSWGLQHLIKKLRTPFDYAGLSAWRIDHSQTPLTEAETRALIDEQLTKVGWEADTNRIRYSKGTRPEKGKNLAIAEWPTKLPNGKTGHVDYALFVGEQLMAMIEAKAAHKDIPSVLDYQGREYPQSVRPEDANYVIGQWNGFQVPFMFATNGRPYIEQFKEKSGVWFSDLRDSLNHPRPLQGWMSPRDLENLCERDLAQASKSLATMGESVLTDPNGLALRDYQLKAIRASEHAISEGQDRVLLAMATGTGKTRTILGMIYRYLTANRFKRILFLVDRTSLGEQALDTFRTVKLDQLMTLDSLYDIKGLEDTVVEPETRLQVATVQAMVKRVFFAGEGQRPSVGDFDLIIVDEAHRGYLLDREMTDEEVAYRDQADFQSTYRRLIDYFDATKIALTATPALHTTQIFGEPVYTYSYREAVMDGYLVDHDAPIRINTELNTKGIVIKPGSEVPIYDPKTGEIQNAGRIEDEITFEVVDFNRKVINEQFDRTALDVITRDIDPASPREDGKTLIFAVDDAHADRIVKILKERFAQQGIEPEAIVKITASAGGANRKYIQEQIKRFKNEDYPSVVVTVDLLTTGVDVPSITSLVFMRRVKSRILFEQMLGRATRLCPELNKDHFTIFDAVGVYDALEPVNTMRPVAVNPGASFIDLLDGVGTTDSSPTLAQIITQIIGKLQRRGKQQDDPIIEHLQDLVGHDDLPSVIETLKEMEPADAAAWVTGNRPLFELLDRIKVGQKRGMVVSNAQDRLISKTRDFGHTSNPADYLDEFRAFIADNRDHVEALNLVCTKPSQLTREALKSLRRTLDREGFTEVQLNRAMSLMKNEEIAADIISIVREVALGVPAQDHNARVDQAMAQLKANHDFSKAATNWLDKIEKVIRKDLVFTIETLDTDSRFKDKGGFTKINLAFDGNLELVIDELHELLFHDEGVVT